MTPDLLQRLAYYQDRLAAQYRTKPKARATIAIFGKQAMADALAAVVERGFDLDTAVGAQLDVIGKYIGLPRNIGLPVPQSYYGYWSTGEAIPSRQNPNGMRRTSDPSVNAQGVYYRAAMAGSLNTALSDEQYRFMLKFKIVLNSNDGTLVSIMDLLNQMLPGTVALVDNADMSLTYQLNANSPVDPAVILPYLPHPMGVLVNFVYFSATVTPASYTNTFHSAAPADETSDLLTCAAANGTGPYAYRWVMLDTTRVGADTPSANTPNASTTTIAQHLSSLGSCVSHWQCVVTDSRGFVAKSNIVPVTIAIDGPP